MQRPWGRTELGFLVEQILVHETRTDIESEVEEGVHLTDHGKKCGLDSRCIGELLESLKLGRERDQMYDSKEPLWLLCDAQGTDAGLKDGKPVRWVAVESDGGRGGSHSGDGRAGRAQRSDSGHVLEVPLSALAGGLGCVGWRNKKDEEQLPGFWPEPQDRADRPLRDELAT